MKPGEQLLQEGEKWRTEDEEAAFPKEIASPNPLFAQSGCHPVPITFSQNTALAEYFRPRSFSTQVRKGRAK